MQRLAETIKAFVALQPYDNPSDLLAARLKSLEAAQTPADICAAAGAAIDADLVFKPLSPEGAALMPEITTGLFEAGLLHETLDPADLADMGLLTV
jgi:hypothetical protein